MKTHKLILAILAVATLGLMTGCPGSSAREVWSAAIKKCAKTDQLGKDIVYFGPSNKAGPGSTFHPFKTGGIQIANAPEDYALPANVIMEGAEYSCDVLTKSGFEFSASAPITEVIGVPAEVALAIKTAKSRNVTTKSIQWVEVMTGRFESHMKKLTDDNEVKLRLEQGDYVLTRALRVRGLEATIKFDANVAPSAKASIPSVIQAGTAKDVTLGATWTDESTLVIKSTADFFIAGELRHYGKDGLANAADKTEIGPLVKDQSTLEVIMVKPQ